MKDWVLPSAALLAVCVFGSNASAQTLSGQALDLRAQPIPNVNVEILSAQGVQLFEETFADGNYGGTALPPVSGDNQGVIVIFSAAGQQTVQVTLHANSDHTMNVVMPNAVDETSVCPPPPCPPPCFYHRERWLGCWRR